jgi:hypothetical protein
VKFLTVEEFVELGLLQEVNRLLLHPRGIALSVTKSDEGQYSFGQVWDYRDDPEGLIFGDVDADKVARFAQLFKDKAPARQRELGYIVQPVLGGNHAAR